MSPTDDAPDQPIKRAPIVYGRRSSDQPPPLPVDSAGEHQHGHRRHAPTVSQWRTSTPSIHASDSGRSCSPSPADSFQFGFRHKLKELDDVFDDYDAQSSRLGLSLDNRAVRAGSSQVKDQQSVSMDTAAFSSEADHSSRDLSRAASPFSTSLPATSAPEHPHGSSSVHRHPGRIPSPVVSRSGEEEPNDSSSASPVRHVITTPHSRSSPTPPTSREVQTESRKTKGKAPARDVLPLLFDSERPSAAETPTKLKRARRSEPSVRPKAKAPTKKDRREAAFESSRIAAGRSVEVVRTQEQKHTLSAFFAALRRDNIATPTLSTELPSDPIEKFSSPIDKSMHVQPSSSMHDAPPGFLRASTHTDTINQLSLVETASTLPPVASESDDDMPSVGSIIQQASGRHQRLQALKRAALQQADTSKLIDDESEDEGLLVVKDDMHSVAREEAAQRRLDKAHGSPVKNINLLRRIHHPSVRPAVVSPRKLSKQELQELAKPSFARVGKGAQARFNKKQLDQLMIMQHTEEQLKSIKRQEEEWVSRGGRLSRESGGDDTRTSLRQRLEMYAEQGLKAAEISDVVGGETSADDSDEDYIPDLQGSSSPKSVEGDTPGDSMEVVHALRSSGHEDGEDDHDDVVALKRSMHSRRRPARAVVGSDDEEAQSVQCSLPPVQRDCTSSMESQTEDENDKENSAKLMYDRSEDKENKAVVRHELSSSETPFSSRLGSLFDSENGAQRTPNSNDITELPKGDIRSPLKDISKDEDDLPLSPLSKSPFSNRLLQRTTVSPCHIPASTLSPGSAPVSRSVRISRIDRLSLDSENDENDPSGFKPLQPSFLERLHSQTNPESSLAALNPLANGGFSQLFSAEDLNLKNEAGKNDGLSLTLDVGLKPALEVSSTLRRKAEIVFEKEQEYVVAAAAQQNDRLKEPLYVNDHGFLTQTRPGVSSPQIYRTAPSQASRFIGTQVYSTQPQSLNAARTPLRTLSLTSRELSPELQPLKRLRKRSLSPLDRKPGESVNPANKLNAFSILGKVPKSPPKARDGRHDKSEFVAVEAEESDEDDMFGFGAPKKDNEEEEEDKDQDEVVEGLVDDTFMDVETEAADLVQEKYREHGEEDDQQLQKLHEGVIRGELRMKRRYRGIGIEDDSEEDDENERHIRRRQHKKRRIEGDNLEALGQNEETRAFYTTYHQDLIDEDDEFGYLRGDDSICPGGSDTQAEEPEKQETVSMDEIRQRVREMAQNNHEVETLDPEDTSWIDQSMSFEADDAVRVKVVDSRRSKPVLHRPAGQVDFDDERPARHKETEQERKQMTSWAKNQSRGRQGTGRSGNTAAVTGHPKAKSGGGSLRLNQLPNPTAVSVAPKGKTPSLLSTVSNRSGKFA